jgi:hypothetical protein
MSAQEDALVAADQMHRDLAAIADELAGIREALLQALAEPLEVRQSGAWITREDRP